MKKYNILIVDDQAANLEAIVNIIEASNEPYNLFQAFSGELAYNISAERLPDLIITDWDMPGISGIELISKLKSNPDTKDIPVIMCTGAMTSSENLKTALSAGAVDFITKPVDEIELTARLKSMLALSDSYKHIKELNHYKDKFLSIIAHDLKNPLGSFRDVTKFLYESFDAFSEEEKKDFLIMIHKSSKQLYELLENLLQWSRSQTGRINFIPQEININRLVEHSKNVLLTHAESKQIELINEINTDITAFADPNMINAIIRNLVSNAIKFTHKNGKIKIAARYTDLFTEVSVSDNGIGMQQHEIDKLFQVGVKYSNIGTNDEQGTGLGLILCKEFLTKNSGTIQVESKPEKGSTFSFKIPRDSK